MPYAIAILGAGNMAEAIVRGLLNAHTYPASAIIAADVSPARRELFADGLKVRAVENPADAVADANTVLLAVKPQQMAQLLEAIAPVLEPRPNALLVSIAAGIATRAIEQGVPARQGVRRVVRAMPNTPMLVGEGMVGLAKGSAASDADIAFARDLFSPAAKVIEVKESDLDAVTAISGSGPAYFFFLVEQMIAAGEGLGLSREQATLLASQTAVGAAKMLMGSTDTAAELRRKVTSPGGTTHAAISHLEAHGAPQIVIDAVRAAHRRGTELGR